MARLAARLKSTEALNPRPYTIGEAAAACGITAKMIRHYEAMGLVPAALRTTAGYRLYGDKELHRLRFIRRARGLGFSIKEIGHLLCLWDDRQRASREVKRLATQHAMMLEQKILELESMRATLMALVHRCQGNTRPDCPILDDLASL